MNCGGEPYVQVVTTTRRCKRNDGQIKGEIHLWRQSDMAEQVSHSLHTLFASRPALMARIAQTSVALTIIGWLELDWQSVNDRCRRKANWH